MFFLPFDCKVSAFWNNVDGWYVQQNLIGLSDPKVAEKAEVVEDTRIDIFYYKSVDLERYLVSLINVLF